MNRLCLSLSSPESMIVLRNWKQQLSTGPITSKRFVRRSMLIQGAGLASPRIMPGIIRDPALNDGLKPCGGPHSTSFPSTRARAIRRPHRLIPFHKLS
ncbi:hypothetical protein AVEN_26305-1 [Araneus ventricosus]|uniref:Uncharacterized protein n=1 Tax=Araneus ventricosus TaxID=182803 RepID=A0A4Y2ANN7_ARAVE|nr:hypothetical protein AVEN_26305-1 [Araneus ventricosus]